MQRRVCGTGWLVGLALLAGCRWGRDETKPARSSSWDLEGSHTQRVERPCSIFVSPRGRDERDGRTVGQAVRSPARAVELAAPGETVCFAAGRYGTLDIHGVKGTADAPVVFRALPGAERQAVFSAGGLDRWAGVAIRRSSHVHVYDLWLRQSQVGIGVEGSGHVRLEGLWIDSVGRGGMHVRSSRVADEAGGFEDLPSHHCDIIGNTVVSTGNTIARYGEGLYVGSGGHEGDATHHVFAAYNRFEQVRAEAIDVKPYTSKVVVRGNVVSGGSHFFHGAIAVGVQAFAAPDARVVVEGNRVHGFRSTGETVAGIVVGQGQALVRNNIVWDIDGGVGIRTTTTFANPAAREVRIENNVVWTPGGGDSIRLHSGHERTGLVDALGEVSATGNRSDDGSAGSSTLERPDALLVEHDAGALPPPDWTGSPTSP